MPFFPNFTFSPNSAVAFGSVTESTSSPSMTLTLGNNGSNYGTFQFVPSDARFVVNLISTTGVIGVIAGGYQGTLYPGQVAVFGIVFNANATPGSASATYFTDITYGGTTPSPYYLTATTVAGGSVSWNVVPGSSLFGNIYVGRTAGPLTWYINNTSSSMSLVINSITSNKSEFTVVPVTGSLPATIAPLGQFEFTITCTAEFQGYVYYPDGVTVTPSSGAAFDVGLGYTGFIINPAFVLTGATQGVLFGLGGNWNSTPQDYVAQSKTSLACEAPAQLNKMVDFGNPSAYTYFNRMFMRVDPLGTVEATVTDYSTISEEFTTTTSTAGRTAASTDSLNIPDVIVFDLEGNAEVHLFEITVAAAAGILSIQSIYPAYEPRGSVYEST